MMPQMHQRSTQHELDNERGDERNWPLVKVTTYHFYLSRTTTTTIFQVCSNTSNNNDNYYIAITAYWQQHKTGNE